MTKYRKSKNKRSQRGGYFDSWFTETSPNASGYSENYGESYSKKAKEMYDNSIASLKGLFDTSSTTSSTYMPPPTSTPTPTPTPTSIPNINPTPTSIPNINPTPTTTTPNMKSFGGKKHKKMKGGKGGLGLIYYATPVLTSNVVEPNEWLLYNNGANQQGGSRKRKCKTRKCKTRKCKTRKCKM